MESKQVTLALSDNSYLPYLSQIKRENVVFCPSTFFLFNSTCIGLLHSDTTSIWHKNKPVKTFSVQRNKKNKDIKIYVHIKIYIWK